MGTRFLLQLLLLGNMIHPVSAIGPLPVKVDYMLNLRLNFHIICYPSSYFIYKISVKELNTGIDLPVGDHSGSGTFMVDGSLTIKGVYSWTGTVFHNFAVHMSSNCTMNGDFEDQQPVNLVRCPNMFLCDSDAYFIIIYGDRPFAAEPLFF